MSPALIDLKTAEPDLRAALIALNNLHAEATSYLTASDWDDHVAKAHLAWGYADASGLIMVYGPNSDAANPHIRWFRERSLDFLYIDRIVIASGAVGQGRARALYEAVIAAAHQEGFKRLVAEINISPANPGSEAFHARLGFSEVGKSVVGFNPAYPTKQVRYVERCL
jgi:uncharacterized protein